MAQYIYRYAIGSLLTIHIENYNVYYNIDEIRPFKDVCYSTRVHKHCYMVYNLISIYTWMFGFDCCMSVANIASLW